MVPRGEEEPDPGGGTPGGRVFPGMCRRNLSAIPGARLRHTPPVTFTSTRVEFSSRRRLRRRPSRGTSVHSRDHGSPRGQELPTAAWPAHQFPPGYFCGTGPRCPDRRRRVVRVRAERIPSLLRIASRTPRSLVGGRRGFPVRYGLVYGACGSVHAGGSVWVGPCGSVGVGRLVWVGSPQRGGGLLIAVFRSFGRPNPFSATEPSVCDRTLCRRPRILRWPGGSRGSTPPGREFTSRWSG